jgi:hypothetical protein
LILRNKLAGVSAFRRPITLILGLMFLSAVLMLTSNTPQAQATGEQDCDNLQSPSIAFYEGANFSGASICFTDIGSPISLNQYNIEGSTPWGEEASSVKVSGARVSVWDASNWEHTFNKGTQIADLKTIGWNNRILTFAIPSPPKPSKGRSIYGTSCNDHMQAPWVALYWDSNFGREAICFLGTGKTHLMHWPSYSASGETWEFQPSAINVGANVTFFDENNKQRSFDYGTRIADLGTVGWDDRITALQISG